MANWKIKITFWKNIFKQGFENTFNMKVSNLSTRNFDLNKFCFILPFSRRLQWYFGWIYSPSRPQWNFSDYLDGPQAHWQLRLHLPQKWRMLCWLLQWLLHHRKCEGFLFPASLWRKVQWNSRWMSPVSRYLQTSAGWKICCSKRSWWWEMTCSQ